MVFADGDTLSWQVKMRMVNRDVVLPRQSLLFLLGKKSDVYVLLKVLIYCTGSSAKSLQCKYAIDDKLHNSNQEQIDLCDAIRQHGSNESSD